MGASVTKLTDASDDHIMNHWYHLCFAFIISMGYLSALIEHIHQTLDEISKSCTVH